MKQKIMNSIDLTIDEKLYNREHWEKLRSTDKKIDCVVVFQIMRSEYDA